VVSDPRWLALYKLWLAEKTKRNALKTKKDLAQGELMLSVVNASMLHYPLDDAF
jgi:hypothetical protein